MSERFGLSRRRLLGVALGGGVLARGLGGGVRAVLGPVPPGARPRVLSPREHATLAAIARAHLPRGGAFPLGADDFELASAFDAFLVDEPPSTVRDLKRALLLVELGPLLFAGEPRGFGRLAPAAQLAHWQSWAESERLLQRQVAVAFRKFLSLVFYDQPAVWPHIGYPGPSFAS